MLCTKNVFRIINTYDQKFVFNAPWPAIYSMKINENNKIKHFEKIF